MEKVSHHIKHIRSLMHKGKQILDPKEILHLQADFYVNLMVKHLTIHTTIGN